MTNLRKTFLVAIPLAVAFTFQINTAEAGYGSSGGAVVAAYVGGSSGGSSGGSVGGRHHARLHAHKAKKAARKAARRAGRGFRSQAWRRPDQSRTYE